MIGNRGVSGPAVAIGIGMAWLAFGPAARAYGQAVRDSAGVRIVENARPLLPAARSWRVDPRPEVDIGGNEATAGDTLYEFVRVNGAVRLSDGRIVVAVDGSLTLRFYDARGRFVRSAGRDGDGPGEFRQLMGLHALRGDTLFVTDLGEVEYYTGDGRFARRGASRATNDQGYVWPGAVFDDGSYVGLDWNDTRAVPAGRQVRSLPLVRVSADGQRHDTIATLPAMEQVFDGRGPFGRQVVFAPAASVAAGRDRFYHGFPIRYEITVFDRNGSVLSVIRRAATRQRVTEAEREAYRSHTLQAALSDPYHPTTRERAERSIAQTVFAEEYPFFADLLADRTGHLWVKHYDYRDRFMIPGRSSTRTIAVPTRWDVFDPRGAWLCTVELPARFTPFEIGADYVVGLARDTDDIEQVHLYRLLKP